MPQKVPRVTRLPSGPARTPTVFSLLSACPLSIFANTASGTSGGQYTISRLVGANTRTLTLPLNGSTT